MSSYVSRKAVLGCNHAQRLLATCSPTCARRQGVTQGLLPCTAPQPKPQPDISSLAWSEPMRHESIFITAYIPNFMKIQNRYINHLYSEPRINQAFFFLSSNTRLYLSSPDQHLCSYRTDACNTPTRLISCLKSSTFKEG